MTLNSTLKNKKIFNFNIIYFLLLSYTILTLIAFINSVNAADEKDFSLPLTIQPAAYQQADAKAQKTITQEPLSSARQSSCLTYCDPTTDRGIRNRIGITASVACATGTIAGVVAGTVVDYSTNPLLHGIVGACAGTSSSITCLTCTLCYLHKEKIPTSEVVECSFSGIVPSLVAPLIYTLSKGGGLLSPLIAATIAPVGQCIYIACLAEWKKNNNLSEQSNDRVDPRTEIYR